MKHLLVIAAAIALLASACSGDDGASISIGDDEGGGGGGDWCARAAAFDDSVSIFDGDTAPSAAAMEAAYNEIRDQFDSIRDDAPPEIKADVETSIEGFVLIFDAFEDADFDFLKVDLAALEALDDPKYTESSDNVADYLADTCGIGEGSSPDDSSFDDSSPDDSSSDDSSPDDSSEDDFDIPTEGTVRDVIIESLVEAGFTQPEADCLADKLGGDLLTAGADDPSVLFDAFEECGIDLSRLSEIGG